MASQRSYTKLIQSSDRFNIIWVLGLILFGLGMSFITANLVVAELWPVALGLIIALPALVLLQKYPLLGLFLWLALAPLVVVTEGGAARKLFWAIHRLLPMLTVVVIVFSAKFGVHKRKLPKLGWAEVAMAVYLLLTLFSVLYLNESVLPTIYEAYDRIFIPMCLYLIVRLAAPTEEDMRRLMPILLFVLIVQSFIGILSWTAPHLLPSSWLGRVGTRTTGSLRNPSVFSITILFTGVLYLHAGMRHRLRSRRVWSVVFFALTLVMVYLSFTRSNWIAGIIVCFGLIWLYPKLGQRIAMLVAISAIVVVVAASLTNVNLGINFEFARERLYSDQSEESALSRLPVYYASYRMFQTKPAFGWGFDNFDRFDRQFQARIGDLISPEKDHASHNLYLTLLAEQGIVGLLFYLAPMFYWLIQTIRVYPKMPREGFWNRKLVVILWLLVLSHIIVNNFSNMRVVYGLGLWWITLGLIANLVQMTIDNDNPAVLEWENGR